MNKFSKFDAQVICELHPLFKGLLWVAAARSTDETRQALQLIHVERDGLSCHIVATDGRRLHHHEFDPGMFDDDIEMMEPGNYEVVTKTSKLIAIAESKESYNYPNWRQVVPDDVTEHSEVIDARSIGKLGIRTGVLIGADFARQAIGFGCGRKTSDSVLVEFASTGEGGTGAMVIEHDLGKAIVMPMRMDPNVSDEERKSPKSDAEATPEMPSFTKQASDPMDALKNAMEPGDEMIVELGGVEVAKFTKPKNGKKKEAESLI